MHRAIPFFLGLVALVAPAGGWAQKPPAEIRVATPRVRMGDVVPSAPAEVRDVDLGAAPAPGGSRVITRDELRHALADVSGSAQVKLPDAVRVVRKTAKLGAAELERIARRALAERGLPRGATLAAVRAKNGATVADGWDVCIAEVPRPPHRAGKFPTTATLTFAKGAEVLAKVPVPIELVLSAEAAAPDLAKGASVTLVLKRGLVEISAPAVANADADIGTVLPVSVRPSGRVMRARLLDKERALAVDGVEDAAPAGPPAPAPKGGS